MNSVRELLAASVISIQNSCFFYPACQKCYSRLILDSQRFNCLKCGCTGDVKEARYRYRLSLKIADTGDLFDITVFGSCLDPFFGVTAENLQRCIQDFNQLSGETNPDSSPEALVQAVEACFIGKRFLFGVKDRAREDGGHSAASSVFPNCSRIRSGTKKLTACQLFLPNAAVTGFTVIGYFHRLLQLAEFRSCNKSSDLTVASSGPADESVSELSSLSSLSTNSCLLHSGGRESCSGPWQQSLLLTSSVAWVTAEDFPTLELGKAVSEQHEQGGTPVCAESRSVSLNSGTLWDSELWSCSVQEGERKEGKGLSLQPSQPDGVSATAKLESKSSDTECSRANSCRLLPLPLAVGVKSLCPEADSRNAFYPEKSHHSLFPKREASDPNHVNRTGVSQVGSVLWDELPLSESLNEFLARLEGGKNGGTSPSLGAGEQALPKSSTLDVNLNKPCPRETLVAGDLPAASVPWRFLPPAESDSWESTLLACVQSNASALRDEVSPRESSSRILSSADKDCEASCFIPNPPLHSLTESLPVTSEPPVSESRYLQPKAANIDSSEADGSFISLQRSAEHRETSCLKRNKRAACLHSLHDGCLAGESKENSFIPNPRTDLTVTGAWNSDPATPSHAGRVYKRELKPLTELSENTFTGSDRRMMLWGGIFPEGSYNASADLFDATAREGAKPVRFLNKSWHSLIEEDTWTEKVPAPELRLCLGNVPRNSSKRSSSLHASPALGECRTPVTYPFCNSDCSSVNTQDFVPYSQSTPMTKPLQKLWPGGEKSSFVTVFTPKNPTKIHSKCKRSRSSFRNTLLQQLTGRLVKRERPSSREVRGGNSSISQQFLHGKRTVGSEEWIPPSANKRLKLAVPWNLETLNRAAGAQRASGHAGRSPAPESQENSENADTDTTLTTPASAGVTEALFFNDSVLETSKGRNSAGGVWNGAAGWSPELFF